MQKPRVLYYLHTYFMDNAIEQLKILSQICDLHLVIELSPDSMKSTIIDFSNYNLKPGVHSLLAMLDIQVSEKLYPYFTNLKSVNYAYYPAKHMIDFINLKTIKDLINLLKTNKIDTIHFDTTSARFLPAIPFILKYKKLATIHDPLPHIGEQTFKRKLTVLVYNKVINKYLFYSSYAANQFSNTYPRFSRNIYIAKLLPYNYISTFNTNLSIDSNYILYFGRLSYYKGIDILLNALDILWLNNPNIKVIIAGKAHGNYHVDLLNENRRKNITYLPGYINIEDLSSLIKHAMFVVCPYREATQSGVLMTALAMHKPVLATIVGAFPEYIQEEKNGILSAPDEHSLVEALKRLLHNNHYKKIENLMQLHNSKEDINSNKEVYKKFYKLD